MHACIYACTHAQTDYPILKATQKKQVRSMLDNNVQKGPRFIRTQLFKQWLNINNYVLHTINLLCQPRFVLFSIRKTTKKVLARFLQYHIYKIMFITGIIQQKYPFINIVQNPLSSIHCENIGTIEVCNYYQKQINDEPLPLSVSRLYANEPSQKNIR